MQSPTLTRIFQPMLPSTSKTNTIVSPHQPTGSTAACSFTSPEHFRRYPQAGPRKNIIKGRKKKKSIIATDTPKKDKIEAENKK